MVNMIDTSRNPYSLLMLLAGSYLEQESGKDHVRYGQQQQ